MLRRGWIDTLFTVIRGSSRTPETIQSYQSRQLKRILKHADRIPFYRRQFRMHGFDPADCKGIEDLSRIPMTTKDQIRFESFEDLAAPGIEKEKLIHYLTSGSTGQPMSVRIFPIEEILLGIFRMRAYREFGFRVPEQMVRIRNSKLATRSPLARILSRTGLYKIHEISSSVPSNEVIKTIRRLQPDSLVTYPGSAYRVAKQMTAEDLEDLNLRWMSIGGSTSSLEVREEIGKKFGIRPFQVYGSREVGIIAFECRTRNCLHINDDAVIFEILDDGLPVSPGQSGEVVVTALHSFAQPFIRFKLHDTVIKGPDTCGCGLPYSSISSIQGRIFRRLKLPDGRTFAPSNIFNIIETELKWVAQYQLQQETISKVNLLLVPKDKPSQDALSQFQKRCQTKLPGIKFRVNLVNEIPFDENGKYRLVVSSFRSDDIPEVT